MSVTSQPQLHCVNILSTAVSTTFTLHSPYEAMLRSRYLLESQLVLPTRYVDRSTSGFGA